jgi:hypothetical protein
MTESKSDRKKSTTQRSSAKTASTKSGKNASSEGSAAKKGSKSTDAPGATSTSKEATASSPAARTQVIDEQPKLPTSRGKITIFGGPRDRGIKPDDKLALPTGPHGVYERVRNLNPKSFYCAMRWNYHVQHMTPEEVKRWWANKKIRVGNTKNDAAVVVRAVDYGPHENTGFDIGLSPGAAEALGVEIGDEVDIALADPKAPLGPTE